MSIIYQVYSNGGSGGPIDYSSPIATVAGTSYASGPLSVSSDYRFAVRAMDTTSGLVEANTQASVRVRLDSSGNDIGQAPNAPLAPVARATSNGGCLVTWSYFTAGQAVAPKAFLIYMTVGLIPNLTSPAATIPYQSCLTAYSLTLSGLSDALEYTIAIVAQSASGARCAAVTTTVVGDATPPDDVESLAAVAVP